MVNSHATETNISPKYTRVMKIIVPMGFILNNVEIGPHDRIFKIYIFQKKTFFVYIKT